jgi:hypothetical protein
MKGLLNNRFEPEGLLNPSLTVSHLAGQHLFFR